MRSIVFAIFALSLIAHCCAFADSSDAKDGSPRPQSSAESTPWDTMDYGPFFSGLHNAKNITIRIGTNQAGLCFDTELLRMASAWTGAFIKLPTARNGFEGRPVPAGQWAFSTLISPGWANGESVDDPRPVFAKEHYGSLPPDWGHFKGLYVNGEKVILSYTVGSNSVLELPGFRAVDEVPIFFRSFHVDASSVPMTLLVCEHDGAIATNITDLPGLVNAAKDYSSNSPVTVVEVQGNLKSSQWEVDQAIRLHIPPSSKPFDFTVLLSSGSMSNAVKFAKIVATNQFAQPDLPTLCKGGRTQWPEIVTRGKRGEDKDAYAVDVLTLPTENPWRSWIRPSGFDFFSDGRMALCSVSGDVWVVSGINEDLDKLIWKRFAAGLFQPLGLKIVHDEVYVLGRDQITRLHDLNGDGEADYYENFNSDVPNGRYYHEFCYDLQTDEAGNFYFAKGSNLKREPNVPYQGTLLKLSPDGKKLDVIADGFRAPNGLAIGPHGEMTISDNEGEWVPASRLNWVKPGGFYGFVPTGYRNNSAAQHEAPIFFLPQTVDNSSGGQVWVTSDKWGPFKGNLLHTSYGTCSLFNVMMENVNGAYQGGVVRFPLKFDSGIMRARFNPRDGQLYLCGTGGWQTSATKDGGLYRVRYTGKPVRMPNGLHVTKNSIAITFTCALEEKSAVDPENYSIEQWNYLWSEHYGSREFSVTEPKGTRTHDVVPIKSVSISGDKKTVTIQTDPLVPVNQMKISFNIQSADGVSLTEQIYNTINRLP